MQQPHMRRWTEGLLVSALLSILVSGSAPAQHSPTTNPGVATRPVSAILARLGESAGVVVVADSTVQGRLAMPAEAATPGTIEKRLGEIVRALPAGTTWIKLYVPAPVSGRWDGNSVADYARAQARQIGTVARPAPEGTVEILGRYVPREKAREYATALNLKLVYLVTNPRPQTLAGGAGEWSRMTTEQREWYARQQAQRLMTLDPASRINALRAMVQAVMAGMEQGRDPGAQGMILKMVASQLSVEERGQLRRALGGRKLEFEAPSDK